MNDGIGERLVLIIPRWEAQWLTTTWQKSLKLFLAAAVKLRTAAGVLQESTWSNLITHSSFSQKHASAVAWKTLSKVCGSSPSPVLWKDVTGAGASEEPAQATLSNTFVWCPDWSHSCCNRRWCTAACSRCIAITALLQMSYKPHPSTMCKM